MGQTCCRCFPLNPGRRSLNILIVGLDQSGKTSVVSSLQLKPWEPQPTTHFSKPTLILYKKTLLRLYDLGGRLEHRKAWKDYLSEVHAILFVVDATGHSRHKDAAMALRHLLQHPCGKDKHVLVLANKQDLAGALSGEELAFRLSLEQYSEPLVQAYPCKAKLHSGAKAPDWRLEAGLDWLISAVTASFIAVDRRVRTDRANRAKAVLQSDSTSASTTDPFLWKAPQNRSHGRSIARATLAAFEQATSRRWGGTVIPFKRTIPSDVPEGDMESEMMQDTDGAAIEHPGLCESERSFSIDSDGGLCSAQGGINGDWEPTGDVDYDTIQLVRARWKALGLLWPDENMCRSILSSHPGPSVHQSGIGKDGSQISQHGGVGSSHAKQPGMVPHAVESTTPCSGSLQGDTNGPRRIPGKQQLPLTGNSMAPSPSHPGVQVSPSAHAEPEIGEILLFHSDSPRGNAKLPPVKAWGSFRNDSVDFRHASPVPKSCTRPQSQSGAMSMHGSGEAAQHTGKSVSSPGQQSRTRALRFAEMC